MHKAHICSPSVFHISVALAVGLSAIYFIPFFVPVHDGLSVSYLLGYNNRAAILILLIFTLFFALWTRGLGLTLPPSSPSQEPVDSFRRSGQLTIVCSILGSILVWLCTMPFAVFGEAQYFFDSHRNVFASENIFIAISGSTMGHSCSTPQYGSRISFICHLQTATI